MFRRRILLALVAGIAVTGSLTTLSFGADESAPSAAKPRSAGDLAREILETGEYQTELPDRKIELNDDGQMPLWLAEALVVVFWVVLIGIGVLALVALAWQLFDVSALRRKTRAAPISQSPMTLSRRPLEDAEAIAREGRFDEAVHVLLLRSIEELRTGGVYRPSVSLTSREILAGAPLSATQQNMLGLLVDKVEISLFGQIALSQRDYDECAARFREIHRL
ncbi:MAG: hypothetical protein ACKVX7_18440 [Planctomycetota bacterium]